ncbi:IS630 family transposase [bacterium]|nr:IS630 family transposase [bacterium]
MARRRATWKIRQPGLNPERLVFFDETWANTNMTRPRGRVFKGKRLIARTPHGHWKTTTFLAGLRTTSLVAPLVVDGAINGDMFVAYVKQQLTKALRPGDIVILDNLSSHERDETRQAIEAAGAELRFLPPYSPDLNIRSNKLSQSSNGCCEVPRKERWKVSGRHAVNSRIGSARRKVGTSSATPKINAL